MEGVSPWHAGSLFDENVEGEMIPQEEWRVAVDESPCTLTALVRVFGLNYSSLNRWLYESVKPIERNIKKMEEVLSRISQDGKRIPYHKSFGYATEEQVARLQSRGIGPDRDRLLSQIAKQNETQGKTVF